MEITTTARRITRALNAEQPGWRLTFDSEGRTLHRIYDPEGRTELVMDAAEKARVRHTFTRTRQRRTYREIQDAITPLTAEEQQIMDDVWQEMQDEHEAWLARLDEIDPDATTSVSPLAVPVR